MKNDCETMTAEHANAVEIYTDGACKGNPGIGGWGALLQYNGHTRELFGGEKLTTNNRMELLAVIRALEALKQPCHVRLHTDSTYVQKGISEWIHSWKKRDWRTAASLRRRNLRGSCTLTRRTRDSKRPHQGKGRAARPPAAQSHCNLVYVSRKSPRNVNGIAPKPAGGDQTKLHKVCPRPVKKSSTEKLPPSMKRSEERERDSLSGVSTSVPDFAHP